MRGAVWSSIGMRRRTSANQWWMGFSNLSHSFLLRIYDACQHPHTCNLVCLGIPISSQDGRKGPLRRSNQSKSSGVFCFIPHIKGVTNTGRPQAAMLPLGTLWVPNDQQPLKSAQLMRKRCEWRAKVPNLTIRKFPSLNPHPFRQWVCRQGFPGWFKP